MSLADPGPGAAVAKRSVLEAVFDLVEPVLAADFASEESRAVLRRWLRSRPACLWAGLELRLAGERGVDAHQGFRATDRDVLHAMAASTDQGIYRQLLEWVLEDWRGGETSRAATIDNLVLEYDLCGSDPSMASVFLQFAAKEWPLPDEKEIRRRAIRELLRIAGLDAALSAIAEIEQCLPQPAYLSHLGFMLARPRGALRLNVRAIPLNRLATLPAELGWLGDRQQLSQWVEDLGLFADRLNLCLDLVPDAEGEYRLGPRLGLECAVESHSFPRWKPLVRRLADSGAGGGLERATQLLGGWPGSDTPLNALGRWPPELITEDLRGSLQVATVVRRYLSHLKLSLQGDHAEAKAYLGFVGRRHEPQFPSPARTPVPLGQVRDVGQALKRASAFLCRGRGQTGYWTDFPRDGFSDEWISAYVATALAGLDDDADAAARGLVPWVLRRQHADGGWAFDAGRPSDADSTAWTLRFLRRLGTPSPEGSLAFLRRHWVPGKGIATYCLSPALAEMSGVAISHPTGWTMPHDCVTAAAAGVEDLNEACCKVLLDCQAADGSWAAYWWNEDAYATALAVESLAGGSDARRRRALHGADSWARSRLKCGGPTSVFGDALLLRILALAPAGDVTDRLPIQELLGQLLDAQRPDGGWAGDAALRMAPPDCLQRDTSDASTVIALDHRGFFTTATVVEALRRWEDCATRYRWMPEADGLAAETGQPPQREKQ